MRIRGGAIAIVLIAAILAIVAIMLFKRLPAQTPSQPHLARSSELSAAERRYGLAPKRDAAVRNALVSKKGVAGARMTSAGFGESRPKDTNDTLEGRARNRRVELVRVP